MCIYCDRTGVSKVTLKGGSESKYRTARDCMIAAGGLTG